LFSTKLHLTLNLNSATSLSCETRTNQVITENERDKNLTWFDKASFIKYWRLSSTYKYLTIQNPNAPNKTLTGIYHIIIFLTAWTRNTMIALLKYYHDLRQVHLELHDLVSTCWLDAKLNSFLVGELNYVLQKKEMPLDYKVCRWILDLIIVMMLRTTLLYSCDGTSLLDMVEQSSPFFPNIIYASLVKPTTILQ
jgi:hypothetical protein